MNQAEFNARVLEILERLSKYAESPSSSKMVKELRLEAEAVSLVPLSASKTKKAWSGL